MKKRLLIVFVFFTIISFYSLASAQSINDGFRGVPWGTSLSSFHNSNEFKLDNKKPKWDIFTRLNENMSFGNAQLSRVWYYANETDGFFGVIIRTSPGFGKTLIENVAKIMGKPTSYNIVQGDMQIFQSYLGGSSKDYEYIWHKTPIHIRIEHQIARANLDRPNSPDRDVAEMKIIYDPTIPSGGGF